MITKLISKIRKTNAPIVVGLDPMMKYVPEHIKKAAFAEYGETLEGAAEAIDYCHEKDLVVIGDVKRGDIGSTSEAYAVGHLGKVQVGSSSYSGFDEDFVTVNPYLGSDGVNPFIKVCREEKKGIFVLVKTSNPSSGELQDRLVRDEKHSVDRPVYEIVGEQVAAWGNYCMPEE